MKATVYRRESVGLRASVVSVEGGPIAMASALLGFLGKPPDRRGRASIVLVDCNARDALAIVDVMGGDSTLSLPIGSWSGNLDLPLIVVGSSRGPISRAVLATLNWSFAQ